MIVKRYQDIIGEKIRRQEELKKTIKNLEFHASGHCVHMGKISPGCRRCFTGEAGSGIQIGAKCMYNCPYCYYDTKRHEEPQRDIDKKLADFFYASMDPQWRPRIFSYQSSGETLLYIDELARFSAVLRKKAMADKINHYYFLYTNGMLATEDNLNKLKEMGVHEIRFHVSASNFSTQVYKNMENAAKKGFFITIEEPSWPLHREKLFEMLHILNDVGGKHLDIVEVQITRWNKAAIEEYYPGSKGTAYKDFFYHLYDGGLVYDIMEEVSAKGYNYSVLDCSSAVERCRHNNDQDILFDAAALEGMCADWIYYLK